MLAGSMYWQEDRSKRKEFEGVMEEKKRMEKRDAWLRELEARDEEDKRFKEKMQKRRRRSEGEVKESPTGLVTEAVTQATERQKDMMQEHGKRELDAGANPLEATTAEAANRQAETKSVEESGDKGGVLSAVKSLIGRK